MSLSPYNIAKVHGPLNVFTSLPGDEDVVSNIIADEEVDEPEDAAGSRVDV